MIKDKNKLKDILIGVLLFSIVLITLLPLIWMLSASLKANNDVFSIPIRWIPETFRWSNYATIWDRVNLGQYTFNSFKLTFIITTIQVITSSFAAYGFAKCKFRGVNTLFLAYVATIAIPWQVYMLPQFIEMRMLGLLNSHTGYIMLQSFTVLGVFLMRQFFMSVPDELLEAARIDGLSEYGIYFRIMLPLSKPAIATLIIISFVTIWNDFMGPLIYFTKDNLKTIPLGIRMFIGQYSADYSLIMAASVLSLIPVLVVFLMFQRFFIEGVTTTGLKG